MQPAAFIEPSLGSRYEELNACMYALRHTDGPPKGTIRDASERSTCGDLVLRRAWIEEEPKYISVALLEYYSMLTCLRLLLYPV